MKKITLSIIALFFAGQMSFAQAVSEHAVIPVSVTLNSILRLNVVTGGNIEFVVNTIDQYTAGIQTSALYTTNFTVASSTDFEVTLEAENASLTGSDDPTNTLTLDNVGYVTVPHAGATGAEGAEWNCLPALGGEGPLTLAAFTIVFGIANNAAGDVVQNTFDIQWELGTTDGTMNGGTLLSQSIPSDRYVTNVFLDLIAK